MNQSRSGYHEGDGELINKFWPRKRRWSRTGRCLGGMEWMDETGVEVMSSLNTGMLV